MSPTTGVLCWRATGWAGEVENEWVLFGRERFDGTAFTVSSDIE